MSEKITFEPLSSLARRATSLTDIVKMVPFDVLLMLLAHHVFPLVTAISMPIEVGQNEPPSLTIPLRYGLPNVTSSITEYCADN